MALMDASGSWGPELEVVLSVPVPVAVVDMIDNSSSTISDGMEMDGVGGVGSGTG